MTRQRILTLLKLISLKTETPQGFEAILHRDETFFAKPNPKSIPDTESVSDSQLGESAPLRVHRFGAVAEEPKSADASANPFFLPTFEC
jgi:hypothetical protein